MSRVPPFPTSSVRRPSLSNGDDSGSVQSGPSPAATPVRPLQINRSQSHSRPEIPSDRSTRVGSSRVGPGAGSPTGPARPQRSDLRSRQISEHTNSIARDRDSVMTTRLDASVHRNGPSAASQPVEGRPRPERSMTARSDDSQTSLRSPETLPAVLSAFTSAGARRRQMAERSRDLEYEREKAQEAETHRQRQQRINDRAPGKRLNGRARPGDIDAVLDQIKEQWEFVIDPEFNSVDLALQLLDDSSLGKDMESFRETKEMLSRALRGSVDKHYQSFAASLPHHASLLNHLGATQQQIMDTRTALLEVKGSFGNKRADLVQLWSRGQTLEEMIKLLDQIEYLKMVPDLLETLMSEKRLLQASVLLVRSLKLINKQDMLEVGAVADLRSYLVGQETALRDILTDELQSHLYLKSFWCASRWASSIPNQQTFQKVEFENEPISSSSNKTNRQSDMAPDTPTYQSSRLTRFLNDLALRPNDPPHDSEEPNFGAAARRASKIAPSISSLSNAANGSLSPSHTHPEADSFAYMETLLESLAVLGQLGTALDTVTQRLPTEIYALVESTLEEVAERSAYTRRGSTFLSVTGKDTGGMSAVFVLTPGESSMVASMGRLKVQPLPASRLRLAALESSSKQADHETLKDLFWTLYSKLDAVTQGLRIVYEVANRIGSRRDFKDSLGAKQGALFPLAEVWAPIQAEVRTLLYDYLTDEEQGAVSGRNPISSINEILREGKFARDRAKNVFRFVDTDIKLANKALKQHEGDLTQILRETMPGLVQGSSEQPIQMTLKSVGIDDRISGIGQRHRTVIKPDAFHVTVLFQPTLAFLARVAEVLPSGVDVARASGDTLEEFVLKVYLPQLEDKVSALFQQAVTGSEAFQPDPFSNRISSQPLLKASIQLLALVHSLCAMLRSTPFHRESYSHLILGTIIQFYQRCSDRFQDLVSIKRSSDSDVPRLTLAAQWAQKSDLSSCLSELYMSIEHVPDGREQQQQLCEQETRLQLGYLGPNPINKSDLIPSLENLSAMASLYRSVTWFAAELKALQHVPDDTSNSREKPQSAAPTTPRSPHSMVVPVVTGEQLRLPLSQNMASRFQALLKTYEQLAKLILDSIRIEVRCRTMYFLDSVMRHGNFFLDREAGEPDPQIIDLNAELRQCDDFVSRTLPTPEQQFIFAGIGDLMESLLISNARCIRFANAQGVKKIIRNTLALQQGIKVITSQPLNREFDRVKRYYSLFLLPSQDVLESVRRKQIFSFDEYRSILKLQYGVDQTAGDEQALDKTYGAYAIDLHRLELAAVQ